MQTAMTWTAVSTSYQLRKRRAKMSKEQEDERKRPNKSSSPKKKMTSKKSKNVSSKSNRSEKKTSTRSSSLKKSLDGLIPKSKRRSVSDAAVDEVRDALSNDLSIKSETGNEYRLTPKGILLAVIDKYYGAGNDLSKFDDFMRDLCQHLSMLATNDT